MSNLYYGKRLEKEKVVFDLQLLVCEIKRLKAGYDKITPNICDVEEFKYRGSESVYIAYKVFSGRSDNEPEERSLFTERPVGFKVLE